eukprot:1949714-Rhodomonas_salina.1
MLLPAYALPCYACPTLCPVLRSRMLLPGLPGLGSNFRSDEESELPYTPQVPPSYPTPDLPNTHRGTPILTPEPKPPTITPYIYPTHLSPYYASIPLLRARYCPTRPVLAARYQLWRPYGLSGTESARMA